MGLFRIMLAGCRVNRPPPFGVHSRCRRHQEREIGCDQILGYGGGLAPCSR